MNRKLKDVVHFLFGCNLRIDLGRGAEGFIRRCDHCHQTWVVSWHGKKLRRISMAEAMDLTEYFSS